MWIVQEGPKYSPCTTPSLAAPRAAVRIGFDLPLSLVMKFLRRHPYVKPRPIVGQTGSCVIMLGKMAALRVAKSVN